MACIEADCKPILVRPKVRPVQLQPRETSIQNQSDEIDEPFISDYLRPYFGRMKVRSSVKKMCEFCKTVKRRGRVMRAG